MSWAVVVVPVAGVQVRCGTCHRSSAAMGECEAEELAAAHQAEHVAAYGDYEASLDRYNAARDAGHPDDYRRPERCWHCLGPYHEGVCPRGATDAPITLAQAG